MDSSFSRDPIHSERGFHSIYIRAMAAATTTATVMTMTFVAPHGQNKIVHSATPLRASPRELLVIRCHLPASVYKVESDFAVFDFLLILLLMLL